jgi:hypothetical protein
VSGPFDRQHPTPVPPPPRDPGESGAWYQAHRELGERLGGAIEDLEKRLGEVRDGDIVAHGLDGKNGKVQAIEKRLDGNRALLIALVCASLGLLGTAATGLLYMRDRVTRSEAQLDVMRPLIEAFARHLSTPAVTPPPYSSGGPP